MSDLYIIQAHTTGAIKIGRSKHVHKRLSQLQTGCPYRLRLIIHIPGQGDLEKGLHRRLSDHRIRRFKGEWFHEEGLAELPTWIYEMLNLEEQDWWRVRTF